jgi:hypothetical protein
MAFKDSLKFGKGAFAPVWINECEFVVAVPTKAMTTEDIEVKFGLEYGIYMIRVYELTDKKRPEQEQRVIDIFANSRLRGMTKVDTPKDRTQIAEVSIAVPNKNIELEAKDDFVDGNVVVLVHCNERAFSKDLKKPSER